MTKKLIKLWVIFFTALTLLSCNNNKQYVKNALKETDEDKMISLVSDLFYDIDSGSVFTWNENDEEFDLNDLFWNDLYSIYDHHLKYHTSKLVSKEWEKWMYFNHTSDEKNLSELVTKCPYCLYIDTLKQNDSSYSIEELNEISVTKLNFFKKKVYPAYQKAKASKLAELEKKKLPDNWKDCRLQGFTYNYSWASRGYYIPSSFANKKAGDVFDKKNVLEKEKDKGTYGVLNDVYIDRSNYTATFYYECYAVSDRADTKSQVKKMGDMNFTVKFSPSSKIAYIYSSSIRQQSTGETQSFTYDGYIYDEEFMANAVEGFMSWIIDTDKL